MQPTSSSRQKWIICGVLLLATTLNYMDRMALNQTAVRIKQYFQLNNQQYGLLEGTFSVAFALGATLFGWLVDRYSVRWMYPLVVLGWSVSGFLTGFAGSFWMLLSCRFFLGLFEAGNWPCGIVTTRRVLKPEERALGNGMFQSGTALGAILTPLIVLACLSITDPFADSRMSAQLLGGFGAVATLPLAETAWQLPFRIIGLLGLTWIVLWFAAVPSSSLKATNPTNSDSGASTFKELLQDRRYWILVLMIVAVNTTWHSFRVWMPLFLQESRGFTESQTMRFSSLYYLSADLGSIVMGWLSLRWASRGVSIFNSRMRTFLICAILALLSTIVVLVPSGIELQIVLALVGFGALGLFPCFFAFSQELSAKHQGKVTGTLGSINAFYLAVIFPLQGKLVDETKSHALGLGLAGLVPIFSLVITWWFWPRTEHSISHPMKLDEKTSEPS
jgi:MFS transporter, ACS family, hexuronate transporter